jgi:hypothetical protein
LARRIFLDTEWTAPPWSDQSQLMWIGLADEQGRSWYGISAEVEIDPSSNAFVAGAFRLIAPDEPRLSRQQLQAAVLDFCGDVHEIWAWVPSLQSFAAWSGLADQAADVFERCWDVDLQMLLALVDPWPPTWPGSLHNLHTAAAAWGVEIPARAPNHLHPRVHAEWNRQLFERIRAAGGP